MRIPAIAKNTLNFDIIGHRKIIINKYTDNKIKKNFFFEKRFLYFCIQELKEMDTVFSEVDVGHIFIGNGYTLKKTSDEQIIHLYRNGKFISENKLFTAIEKKLFVVDLVDRKGVTKIKIASILGISRQSIDNWLAINREHGSLGLINNTKDSWKTNPKRFKGNKARQLEDERKEKKQTIDKRDITINFDQDFQVEEKYTSDARALFNEEYDYRQNRYAGSLLYL